MVKDILAYICFAGAAVSFVAMFPRQKGNPPSAKGEERLTRIEERTGLMILK
jgi:hypothetical protein